MLQKATAHPRGRQCAKHKGRAGIGTAHWAEEKMAYNLALWPRGTKYA